MNLISRSARVPVDPGSDHGPAPGWYQDPGEPDQLRLWNGGGWTDDVLPRSALTATGPATGEVVTRASAPPRQPGARSRSRRLVAVVAAAGTVVLVARAAQTNSPQPDATITVDPPSPVADTLPPTLPSQAETVPPSQTETVPLTPAQTGTAVSSAPTTQPPSAAPAHPPQVLAPIGPSPTSLPAQQPAPTLPGRRPAAVVGSPPAPSVPVAQPPSPAPSVPVAQPPPPTSSTTLAPFAAPRAHDGRVVSCAMGPSGTTWVWVYSLDGGAGWRPNPAAMSVDQPPPLDPMHGVYQETVTQDPGFSETQVMVVDASGESHPVALDSPVSAAAC